MANLNLSQFTEKTFVADADWTFVWDAAGLISKKVSRNNWLNSGELTTSAPVTISQTWDASAVAFTAFKVNATNTNSAAASLLLDLQLGTVSQFSVTKAGLTTSATLALTATTSQLVKLNASNWIGTDSSQVYLFNSGFGGPTVSFNNNNTVVVRSDGGFGWAGSGNATSSADTILLRDGAANTLALRNGTNAQTFNVYGTSSSSNTVYERMFAKYNGTDFAFQIGTETASATLRPLDFVTGGTRRMTIGTTGNVGIGTTAPSQKLEVWGNSAGTISKVTSVSPGTASVLWLDGPVGQVVTSTGSLFLTNQSGTGNIIFETVSSEKMRLQNNGNLGIGTTAPSSKLHVNGAIIQKPDASATPPANGDLVVEATSNTTLTFKLKGTDGTVRSGTITLA